MDVRTVRLDEDAEKALVHIVRTMGLSISGALKQGLLMLRTQLAQPTHQALIVAAEALPTRKIFAIDRQDFATYRIRRRHRYYGVDIIVGAGICEEG